MFHNTNVDHFCGKISGKRKRRKGKGKNRKTRKKNRGSHENRFKPDGGKPRKKNDK